MNNLYTYGCSYTEGFNIESTASYVDYKKYRGDFPKPWAEILAEKLNCVLINRGRGSSGNQEIFSKFCRDSKNFQNNDIVLVQWSFMERHRIAIGNGKDDWLRCGPGRADTSKISQTTNDEICVNRTLYPYQTELYDYMTLMDRFADLINIKLYYWTIIENFIYNQPKDILNQKKYLLNDKIIDRHHHPFRIIHDMGGETIEKETNGVVKDAHIGEKGHEILANLFYKHIEDNR